METDSTSNSNSNSNITPALETLGQILNVRRESNEDDIGSPLTIF